MTFSRDELYRLAGLYGTKTSYLDMGNRWKTASSETLLAVLNKLGAPVAGMRDVHSAFREKQQQYWRELLEPVTVVWGKEIPVLNVRLPVSLVRAVIKSELKLETGEIQNFTWQTDESAIIKYVEIERKKYAELRIYLPVVLPPGYHWLHLEIQEQSAKTLLIAAPPKSYTFPEAEKIWGVFSPLYALHTSRSWGSGNYTDLKSLMEWTASLGGRLTGTLPLLPSFFDKQTGPSPYMPASRLFWNEFFLDIECIPEYQKYSSARILVQSDRFQESIADLRISSQIEYNNELSLKRKVLECLADYFFKTRPERFNEFQQYLKDNPRLEDYAAFRAAGEANGTRWQKWPLRMSRGKLKEQDYSQQVKQYYLYSQWTTQQQIADIAGKTRQNNKFLYLDFPVGVHSHSYDAWRERSSFVTGLHGGAPPDPVFTSGQNWNFPPLHPDNIRRQGYRYIIDCLRHHFRQAGMLRIDHIMGLHRLFVIPEGMDNREGAYISYQPEEMYAVLTLESNRHQSIVIGEDLGIVPPEVRPMMKEHGIYRTYVGQYELIVENRMGQIPVKAVASLNTHDMFPFAAFWQGTDITERRKLGLVSAEEAQKELEQRDCVKEALLQVLVNRNLAGGSFSDIKETLRDILKLLADSPALALLINLEDLWLETRPQNIPGTQAPGNWSRKFGYSFEELSKLLQVKEVLRLIDRYRKGDTAYRESKK